MVVFDKLWLEFTKFPEVTAIVLGALEVVITLIKVPIMTSIFIVQAYPIKIVEN